MFLSLQEEEKRFQYCSKFYTIMFEDIMRFINDSTELIRYEP